jgi:nucleoid-associated protein YgaU
VFTPTSRYAGIETAEFEIEPGRSVRYLRRRLLPPPERFTVLEEHVVVDGDRLDLIAAEHLGDPEQFWRIADANGAMRPEDLTAEPGRRLRITLPEGVQGVPGG